LILKGKQNFFAKRKEVIDIEFINRRTSYFFKIKDEKREENSGIAETVTRFLGVHLTRIAAQFEIDVEDRLASILPEKDEG
jgi:hypothetical protein